MSFFFHGAKMKVGLVLIPPPCVYSDVSIGWLLLCTDEAFFSPLIKIYNGHGFTSVSSMRPAVIRLLEHTCCLNLQLGESALLSPCAQSALLTL